MDVRRFPPIQLELIWWTRGVGVRPPVTSKGKGTHCKSHSVPYASFWQENAFLFLSPTFRTSHILFAELCERERHHFQGVHLSCQATDFTFPGLSRFCTDQHHRTTLINISTKFRGLEIWKWRQILRFSVGFGLELHMPQVSRQPKDLKVMSAKLSKRVKKCGCWVSYQNYLTFLNSLLCSLFDWYSVNWTLYNFNLMGQIFVLQPKTKMLPDLNRSLICQFSWMILWYFKHS